MIDGNKQHNSFTTKYVTLPNGNMYALVITNPARASGFKIKYPSAQIGGYAPDFPEALADEFNNCYSYFNQILSQSKEDANASALAFILDKYNAGVALLKYEYGSFNKKGTIQTGGNGDDATYGKINCPPAGGY